MVSKVTRKDVLNKREDVMGLLPVIFKKIRKTTFMSQAEVADSLGLSRELVSRWEKGTAIPNKEQLEAWLDLIVHELGHLIGLRSTLNDAIKQINVYSEQKIAGR